VCSTVGSSWWNYGFPDQPRSFELDFDATPSAANIDAPVGASAGAVAAWTDMAAIVRFNASGMIDARAGGQYVADASWPYQAGVRYHVRMDINIATHTYSAFFYGPTGGWNTIAQNIPFRTEQAGVTHLANVGSKLDSAGSLQICGVAVGQINPAGTSDGCFTASAGGGFVNVPLASATGLETLSYIAYPSASNVDAVVGLSAGPATAFNSLATAVRFNPGGYVDVRDGDSYRADVQRPYDTNQQPIMAIADLSSHTYSVTAGWADSQEVARQYHFRTQQAGVTHLNNLAAIIDSTTGSVKVCLAGDQPSTGVLYSREGAWSVAPVTGGAFISDGTVTQRVDAHGAVQASIARGGQLAADGSGNVYVASVSGTTLTVEKLSSSLASLWRATTTVPQYITVSIGVDASGGLLIGATTQYAQATTWRLSASGAWGATWTGDANAIGISGGNSFTGWSSNGTLTVTKRDPSGAVLWQRTFAGAATISSFAAVSDGGVVFGGELDAPTDFGGGSLPTINTENGGENGFVVRLGAGGAYVFSYRTGYAYVVSVATNNHWIAVSGYERTQFYYPKFGITDMMNNFATDAPAFDTGFGEHGRGGNVAVSADGHVWWNAEEIWFLSSMRFMLAM
jgi:hypothetical protein